MTNSASPEPELSPELTHDLDVDPALAAAVLEIESHIASGGWDQPARLYALVDTAQLVVREPALASAMGLDSSSAQGSLTAIEQDQLSPDRPLESVVRRARCSTSGSSGGKTCKDHQVLTRLLAEALAQSLARGRYPIGILTHHLVHDEAASRATHRSCYSVAQLPRRAPRWRRVIGRSSIPEAVPRTRIGRHTILRISSIE